MTAIFLMMMMFVRETAMRQKASSTTEKPRCDKNVVGEVKFQGDTHKLTKKDNRQQRIESDIRGMAQRSGVRCSLIKGGGVLCLLGFLRVCCC